MKERKEYLSIRLPVAFKRELEREARAREWSTSKVALKVMEEGWTKFERLAPEIEVMNVGASRRANHGH